MTHRSFCCCLHITAFRAQNKGRMHAMPPVARGTGTVYCYARGYAVLSSIGAVRNTPLSLTENSIVAVGCWCDTTAFTWLGGWSIDWRSQCSRQGWSHPLSDICYTKIVQRRTGCGVETLDYTGYRTISLRCIPLACRYRNASLTRQMMRIHWRTTVWLVLTISKTLNISYHQKCHRVRTCGRYSLI